MAVRNPALPDPQLGERGTQGSSFLLVRAARVLRAGGVIAHATEGVWGLACLASNAQGIRKILRMKNRSERKGLIVIAEDAGRFEAQLHGQARAAEIRASWPGAVTWLVEDDQFPKLVRGAHSTVALRVPAHAQTRRLCALAGEPLVSTSANPQGRSPAQTALQVRQYFTVGGDLNFLLPGETSGRKIPSSIRDARSGVVSRAEVSKT